MIATIPLDSMTFMYKNEFLCFGTVSGMGRSHLCKLSVAPK